VYRTEQLHNGDIDVESTPGVGTTFVIKMPKTSGVAQEVETPSLRVETERLQSSVQAPGEPVKPAPALPRASLSGPQRAPR
jgi:hypothetical protein